MLRHSSVTRPRTMTAIRTRWRGRAVRLHVLLLAALSLHARLPASGLQRGRTGSPGHRRDAQLGRRRQRRVLQLSIRSAVAHPPQHIGRWYPERQFPFAEPGDLRPGDRDRPTVSCVDASPRAPVPRSSNRTRRTSTGSRAGHSCIPTRWGTISPIRSALVPIFSRACRTATQAVWAFANSPGTHFFRTPACGRSSLPSTSGPAQARSRLTAACRGVEMERSSRHCPRPASGSRHPRGHLQRAHDHRRPVRLRAAVRSGHPDDPATAAPGLALSGLRADHGCRRERRRRYPSAGRRRAAGDVFRLERTRGSFAGDDLCDQSGQKIDFAQTRGRATGGRRSAALDRGAVPEPRGPM